MPCRVSFYCEHCGKWWANPRKNEYEGEEICDECLEEIEEEEDDDNNPFSPASGMYGGGGHPKEYGGEIESFPVTTDPSAEGIEGIHPKDVEFEGSFSVEIDDYPEDNLDAWRYFFYGC